MTRRIVASSAAALVLVALLANTAQGETVTLFSDVFSYATGGTLENPKTPAWKIPPASYTIASNCYDAAYTVKLGTASIGGKLMTTNLAVQAGTLTVKVDALGWDGDEKVFNITVGSVTFTLNCLYDKGASALFQTVSQDFTVEEGSVNVALWTANGKRIFFDNIHIYQEFFEIGEPAFAVTMQSPSTVNELSPVQFTITATVNNNPTNVVYASGLPAGASYTFSNGVFSWTPSLGQAGVYPLDFTAPGGDGKTYTNTVAITVNALPLTAPANLAASNIGCEAFDLSWDAVPAATQGYVASVWTGSASPDTPNADLETFWETTDNNPVQPLGWSFTGITLEYMDKGLTEVSFDTTGDTIVTRLYPKAVTELSFRLQGRTTASTSNSVLAVFGTVDGTTWTSLQSYSTLSDSDGNDENNIFSTTGGDLDKSLAFDVASGFRQFKFVYTKDKGNVGIGNIAAVYEGAGTKFVTGWNGAAVAGTGMVVNGVRPGRIYYALVGARNATETKFSQIALATLDAPPMTIIVVR